MSALFDDERIKSLFNAINEKPVLYRRIYTEITGSIECGLLLSQLTFWSTKMNHREFYKSNRELCEELLFKKYTLKLAKKTLVELEVIIITKKTFPAITYYKLNINKIIDLITNYSKKRPKNTVGRKRTNCPVGRKLSWLRIDQLMGRISTNCSLDREYVIDPTCSRYCRVEGGEPVDNSIRSPLRETNTAASGLGGVKNNIFLDFGQETEHTKEITVVNAPKTKIKAPKLNKNKKVIEECTSYKNNSKNRKNLDFEEIVNHWRSKFNHPKAFIDGKPKNLILIALKSYNVTDLKKAIDGCSKTPYNMGQNDRGEIYDGLHIIFKDSSQIERFMRNDDNPPVSNPTNKSFLAQNKEIKRNAFKTALKRHKQLIEEMTTDEMNFKPPIPMLGIGVQE